MCSIYTYNNPCILLFMRMFHCKSIQKHFFYIYFSKYLVIIEKLIYLHDLSLFLFLFELSSVAKNKLSLLKPNKQLKTMF